jgi:hypothetical protein
MTSHPHERAHPSRGRILCMLPVFRRETTAPNSRIRNCVSHTRGRWFTDPASAKAVVTGREGDAGRKHRRDEGNGSIAAATTRQRRRDSDAPGRYVTPPSAPVGGHPGAPPTVCRPRGTDRRERITSGYPFHEHHRSEAAAADRFIGPDRLALPPLTDCAGGASNRRECLKPERPCVVPSLKGAPR